MSKSKRRKHISKLRNRKRKGNYFTRLSIFSNTKKFIAKNSIALISILVTVLTSFFIYYISYAEPNIKATGGFSLDILDIRENADNSFSYYLRYRGTFKNFSTKSGFIDRIEFVPTSVDVNPEIKVTYIEKGVIQWREVKEIEVLFIFMVNAETGEKLNEKGLMALELHAYDNLGKLVTDIDGKPLSYVLGITGKTVSK